MSALLTVWRSFCLLQKLWVFALKSSMLYISYQLLAEVDVCCSDLGGTCWCEGKTEYLQLLGDWQSFQCAVTIRESDVDCSQLPSPLTKGGSWGQSFGGGDVPCCCPPWHSHFLSSCAVTLSCPHFGLRSQGNSSGSSTPITTGSVSFPFSSYILF